MPRPTLSFVLLLGGALVLAEEAMPPPVARPAPAAAQEPLPPTFPGQVEQVTVDVVVTDKKGVPLAGLRAPDFELLEDGVPQTVVSFEAIEVPPAPAAVPEPHPRISTNLGVRERPGRTFVILFDDIRLTPAMGQQARAALADFLTRSVREGDRVTLLAPLAATWWTSRMEAGRGEMLPVPAYLPKIEDGQTEVTDTEDLDQSGVSYDLFNRLRVIDYDRDGRDELMTFVGNAWYVFSNADPEDPNPTSIRFRATQVAPAASGHGLPLDDRFLSDGIAPMVSDFDGDGVPDVLAYSFENVSFSLNRGVQPERHLLRQVSDGVGNQIRVDYSLARASPATQCAHVEPVTASRPAAPSSCSCLRPLSLACFREGLTQPLPRAPSSRGSPTQHRVPSAAARHAAARGAPSPLAVCTP